MIDISAILIIPNTSHNPEKTIDQLLNQTLNNIEILCLNLSDDKNILKILSSYQKYDTRISIINTSSADFEQSIDSLIKNTKGKFISFITSQDYISEDFYEKMYQATLNNPDNIIECKNFYQNKPYSSTTLINKIFPTSLLQKNYKKCISGFQTFENSLLKQLSFCKPSTIFIEDGACFKNSNNIVLLPKKDELIVSLTSYPARIKLVHKTTDTLLNQTLKADKVILWLAKNQFPNQEKDLPLALLSQINKGLSINWYHKDIKSYKKLIPSLIQYPNSVIVTADDDIYYDKKWLENIYLSYLNTKEDCIHCHRAHQILFDSSHQIKKYTDWNFDIHYPNASYNLLFTGVGGVLYPPHSLHPDALNEELFTKLCPHGDDLWFWAMAILNNTQIKPTPNSDTKLNTIAGSQADALCHDNVKNGRNDTQLQNLLNNYPEIYQKLDYNMPILEKKRKYKTLNILGIKIKIKRGIKPLKILKNYFSKYL